MILLHDAFNFVQVLASRLFPDLAATPAVDYFFSGATIMLGIVAAFAIARHAIHDPHVVW